MNAAEKKMPRYVSHKTVWALKIAAIEIHKDNSATIAPKDEGYDPIRTNAGWAKRFMGRGDDLGYYVAYKDGYESWSPAEAFEDGYTLDQKLNPDPNETLRSQAQAAKDPNPEVRAFVPHVLEMPFGDALKLLKSGFLVTRKGWNGRNMFVFMRPEDSIPVTTVIQTVKSLPPAVKDYYWDKYKGQTQYEGKEPVLIKFTAYLCMKAADGSIVNGWLASQTDMLAEDWVVFDINNK